MSDYLMQDDAPLSTEEWETLNGTTVSVARSLLVGRRFIELAGPFGIGTEVVRLDRVEADGACVHEGAGGDCDECECDVARVTSRTYVPLALIHKDFMLGWRDVEAARQSGQGLGVGPAAAAAAAVARAEDEAVFSGLLEAEGVQTLAIGDWESAGEPLSDTSAAAALLAGAGYVGPYTLVAAPDLYAKLQRPYRGSGRLESKLVESIAEGGILRAPTLGSNRALLVSRGAQYIDLAIGQDMAIAYLGPEAMDHRFRVLESLALRVKQPAALCVIA